MVEPWRGTNNKKILLSAGFFLLDRYEPSRLVFLIFIAMNLQSELQKSTLFQNLELLANQVVEGFISGIHKSPFHGFSAEFAEHKIYNNGESTKHIDWKLFAKTDKLYTKRYEEETNLRCHMILDSSASMYYPEVKGVSVGNLNKIGFRILAIAALMNILKRCWFLIEK